MLNSVRHLYCFVITFLVVALVIYVTLKETSKFTTHSLGHSLVLDQHDGQAHIPLAASITSNNRLGVDDKGGEKPTSNTERLDQHDKVEMDKAWDRAMEYCNPTDQHTSGQEGQAPNGFKLRSVHIVIRHGDRSPMYKLPNQDSPSLSCHLDAVVTKSHSHLVESFKDSVSRFGSQIPHSQKFGWYPRQQTCMGAQLTGNGFIQHLVNGDFLQDVYIKRHKLVSKISDPDEVSIRTTEYSRTYQSALAFVHGLFPGIDWSQLKLTTTNNMNFCNNKLSGVICSCRLIGRLKEFSKKEEINMKSNITRYKIALIKQELGDIYGMSTQKIPWIGGIVEVLMGYICHGLPLPCSHLSNVQTDHRERCITMSLVGRMWQYLDSRGSILLSGHANHRYNILFMYPLLREIAQHMVNITLKRSVPKLAIYSGHDLTITPLAKALGIHNGRWPPYGSSIIMELYTSPDAQYYIRILYNGKDKTTDLKFCKSYLRQQMCPLQYFVDFAFHEIFRVFGKDNYEDICRM